MKLYFYRGSAPNFGDELNTWLLPKVFPDFFDDDPSILFLGIGSILFEHEPKASLKIVFGTGYGGYQPLPQFDSSWRVYCVRGPRTATACGFGSDVVAGDAAILINRHRSLSAQKRFARSFIPHWESIDRGHWKAVCRVAGVHFIDPRSSVEQVLDEIQASEVIVTEAMHGAIVADALRVPWIPVVPIHPAHRLKWFDWAEALGIDLQPHRLDASSGFEGIVSRHPGFGGRRALGRRIVKWCVAPLDPFFVHRAAHCLERIANMPSSLSADHRLEQAIAHLLRDAGRIRNDFRKAA